MRARKDPRHRVRWRLLDCFLAAVVLCCADYAVAQDEIPPGYEVDDLLVGTCQLPPVLVRMGQRAQRLKPGRVIMATGVECGIRGGTYVAYDPSNLKTARDAWTKQAKDGEAE